MRDYIAGCGGRGGRGCCAYDRRLASRRRYSPPALRCCFNIFTTTTHLGSPFRTPCEAPRFRVLVFPFLSRLASYLLCFTYPAAARSFSFVR